MNESDIRDMETLAECLLGGHTVDLTEVAELMFIAAHEIRALNSIVRAQEIDLGRLTEVP